VEDSLFKDDSSRSRRTSSITWPAALVSQRRVLQHVVRHRRLPIHEYIGPAVVASIGSSVAVRARGFTTPSCKRPTGEAHRRRVHPADADVCWKETVDPEKNKNWTPGKPFISDIRRSLQREYWASWRRCPDPAGNVLPADLHAMSGAARRLGPASRRRSKSVAGLRLALAPATCKSRIDRMLKSSCPKCPQGWAVYPLIRGRTRAILRPR